MSCHQWWCSLGNCHLQLHIDSAGPDKLVFGDLFALVSVSMRPTWHKLCDISVLSILFPMHWSQLHFLIIIWQFARMSWMRYSSFLARLSLPKYGLSYTLLLSWLKCITHCICSHLLFSLHKYSTFTCFFLYQTPFCQIDTQLLFVTWLNYGFLVVGFITHINL